MKIESRSLATCEISADGRDISLGFIDRAGQPATLKLPLEQAGALAMTLPSLMENALRRQFSDASLRYTYPLASWTFERSSDPSTSIVTLGTHDGFSVCFAIAREQQLELSEALATDSPAAPAAVLN